MLLKKRIGVDSVTFLFQYSSGKKLGAYHDLLEKKPICLCVSIIYLLMAFSESYGES